MILRLFLGKSVKIDSFFSPVGTLREMPLKYPQPERLGLPNYPLEQAEIAIQQEGPVFIWELTRSHSMFQDNYQQYGICTDHNNKLKCIFISGVPDYEHIDSFYIPGIGWFKNFNANLAPVNKPENLHIADTSVLYSGMKNIFHPVNMAFKRHTDPYKVIVRLKKGSIYLGTFRNEYVDPIYNVNGEEVACNFEIVRC